MLKGENQNIRPTHYQEKKHSACPSACARQIKLVFSTRHECFSGSGMVGHSQPVAHAGRHDRVTTDAMANGVTRLRLRTCSPGKGKRKDGVATLWASALLLETNQES